MAKKTSILTPLSVAAIKQGETLWDGQVTGLGIRAGAKRTVWHIKVPVAKDGRNWTHKCETLGDVKMFTLEQARVRAKIRIGQLLEKYGDPDRERIERELNSLTLETAWKAYVQRCRIKGRSARTIEEYEFMLARHFPDWKAKPMAELGSDRGRSDFKKRFNTITRQKGPAAANGAVRAFSAVWNYTRKESTSLPECPSQVLDGLNVLETHFPFAQFLEQRARRDATRLVAEAIPARAVGLIQTMIARIASLDFAEGDGTLDADELESECEAEGGATPGVERFGKSTLYSLAALKQERGIIEPFLDGYFYGNPGGIYVLSGPPKTGKTQLTFSLLSAVAGGDERWMGNRLWLHGPIIWFSLESTHSLLMAMDAWEKKHGKKHPGHDPALFAVTEDGAGFMDLKRLPEIEAMCRGRKVAVIDTMTRALPGKKQNDPEFSTVFYNQLSAIGAKTGTVFIVIHHPPKSDPTGQRGSGDIVGSADGVIAVYKPQKDGPIMMEMQYIRFGRDEPPIFFEIESVEVGYDDRRGRRLDAPFVVQADKPDEMEDAAPSPLDRVAAGVRLHGEKRGDAFVMTRVRARELGIEEKAEQVAFKNWRGLHVGNGYTLDLQRIGNTRAHEIIVQFGWTGELTADELEDPISGLT